MKIAVTGGNGKLGRVLIKDLLEHGFTVTNLDLARSADLKCDTRQVDLCDFGQTIDALSEQESDELWERWTIPSPGKPLFEAAIANFARHSPAVVDRKSTTRGPLLITAGGKDHTVPAVVSRQTQKLYRDSSAVTELRTFADRGHSLTIDSGWREVADSVLGWLRERGL